MGFWMGNGPPPYMLFEGHLVPGLGPVHEERGGYWASGMTLESICKSLPHYSQPTHRLRGEV